MSNRNLEQMHGSSIEVQLEVQGTLRVITGLGIYENEFPELGPALRILVSDPCGDFELIVPESNRVVCLSDSNQSHCDYRISLTNSAAC